MAYLMSGGKGTPDQRKLLNMAGTEQDSLPGQAVIKPAAHVSGTCVFPFSFSITYICCESPNPPTQE